MGSARDARAGDGDLAVTNFSNPRDMSEVLPAIPLADVLRAANELVAVGLIKDYALGGALAAIYYVEPSPPTTPSGGKLGTDEAILTGAWQQIFAARMFV